MRAFLRIPTSTGGARVAVRWFSATDAAEAVPVRRALVWGGNGALGQSIVNAFKNRNWDTVCVDYKANSEASTNIVLSKSKSWKDNALEASAGMGSGKFSVMVNAAGGWAGGNVADEAIFENFDRMMQFNAKTAIAVGHLATKHLAENGLVVFVGADPARRPCPGMAAYGFSKQIVHSLVRTLALPDSGLNVKGARVIGVLPITIDTPPNRAAMPTADTSTWTPPQEFARRILDWASSTNPETAPQTGAWYRFKTKSGTTPRGQSFTITNVHPFTSEPDQKPRIPAVHVPRFRGQHARRYPRGETDISQGGSPSAAFLVAQAARAAAAARHVAGGWAQAAQQREDLREQKRQRFQDKILQKLARRQQKQPQEQTAPQQTESTPKPPATAPAS